MGIRGGAWRQHRWMIPRILCVQMCATTTCEIQKCITTVSLFTTLRFLNGTASCQYGKETSAGNGHGHALFIRDSSTLHPFRLLPAEQLSRRWQSVRPSYSSSMVPPLVRKARIIPQKRATGAPFSSMSFRFLNDTASYQCDTAISAGNGH